MSSANNSNNDYSVPPPGTGLSPKDWQDTAPNTRREFWTLWFTFRTKVEEPFHLQLQRLCGKLELKQIELAEHLNLGKSVVNRWFQGRDLKNRENRGHIPDNLSIVEKIVERLDCSEIEKHQLIRAYALEVLWLKGFDEEFLNYAYLWQVADQAVANPSTENIKAVQQTTDWIVEWKGMRFQKAPQFSSDIASTEKVGLYSSLQQSNVKQEDDNIKKPKLNREEFFASLQPATEPREPFGKALRDLRHKHNLSIGQLSDLIHISSTMISRWERGVRRPPDMAMTKKICRALQLTPEETLALLGLHPYQEIFE